MSWDAHVPGWVWIPDPATSGSGALAVLLPKSSTDTWTDDYAENSNPYHVDWTPTAIPRREHIAKITAERNSCNAPPPSGAQQPPPPPAKTPPPTSPEMHERPPTPIDHQPDAEKATPSNSQKAQEGGGDDPFPDPEKDTQTEPVTRSQAGMSHFIAGRNSLTND